MRAAAAGRRMRASYDVEARLRQVPRTDQLERADAIAEGARRRPTQAFGEYFSHGGGSCAPGAAYEGAYALPREAELIRPRLYRLFDCLE